MTHPGQGAAGGASPARAVVFSAVPIGPEMARYLQPGDFLVACDAGYRNVQRLDLVPDLIVGDFDSAPQPPVLHEHTIVLPHVKDDTDTHFAARWLWQQGCRHVTFLGALGGKRLEHTIANLHTALFLAKQGVEVSAGGCVQRTAHSLPGQAAGSGAGRVVLPVALPAGRRFDRRAGTRGILPAHRRHPDAGLSAGGQQ